MAAKFLFFLFAMLALANPAWADPSNDALDAARRGDYATAIRIWRPLAAQGLAIAQHNMGVLYDNGNGVEQDAAQAARLWRLAADQGYGPSQTNLGVAYALGRGVAQDEREALRLFRLAAAQGLARA